MKTKAAVFASLLMTCVSLLGLWLAQKGFAVEVHAEDRLAQLSSRVMEETIKNQMLLARFEDFRQEVAIHLPENKVVESSKSLRDLASVIPHTVQAKRESLRSQQRLTDAKELYKARKYEEATTKFLEVISQYPESVAQLEASYCLVQAFYLTGNKQEALTWAEKMLSNFPESPWTAKALMVMADIYKEQNRKNDMIDVYQTILDSFNDETIKAEVKKRLAALEL